MSIEVALSTRRDVGRDTYSLPQKRGCAASGTSMDMPPLHKRHLFFAAKTRLCREWHVNGHGTTKLRSRCHVYKFHFYGYYKGNWQGLCREWALLLNVLYI